MDRIFKKISDTKIDKHAIIEVSSMLNLHTLGGYRGLKIQEIPQNGLRWRRFERP